MIAPAAHTSKGLAKAFVSSAGGKRPELPSSKVSGPSFLHPEHRRRPLTSGELQLKLQGLQPTALGYSGVSRPQRVPFCRSGEVPLASSPYFTAGVSSAPGLAKLVAVRAATEDLHPEAYDGRQCG